MFPPRARRFLTLACGAAIIAHTGGCRGPSTSPEQDLAFRNIGTGVEYTGDRACFDCHEEEYHGFQSHGMAQSFYGYADAPRTMPETDTTISHLPTGLEYRVVARADSLTQTERAHIGDNNNVLTRRAAYVIGSGNAARTFLTEMNGRLFELPVTWYASGAKWDFSPGYRQSNARFDRHIPDRCMACHNSYPEALPFADGKYKSVPTGIGCERCHGPGRLHVEERLTIPEPPHEIDDSIVNPAHLDPERRNAVCEQCHLQTTVSVLRRGRSAFDFQPSERLSDHVALFFDPQPADNGETIEVISHADHLRRSACFVGTRQAAHPLECVTCHDPHRGFRDLGPDYFNTTCLGCHDPGALSVAVAPAHRDDHVMESNCFGCHMPKVLADDAPHASFTDHWIRVVGRELPQKKPTSSEPLLPYYDRDAGNREGQAYLGIALIVHGRQTNDPVRMATGVATLEAGLQADTAWAEANFLIGVSYHQLGRPDLGLPYLKRAARLEPDVPQHLDALAQSLESLKADPRLIEPLYRRALEIQPALYDVRLNYAHLLQELGRLEESLQTYEESLDELPWQPEGEVLLGTLLLEMGRGRESRRAFARAVNLDPTLTAAAEHVVLVERKSAGEPTVAIVNSLTGSPSSRAEGNPSVMPAENGTLTASGTPAAVLLRPTEGVRSIRVVTSRGLPVTTIPTSPSAGTAPWDLTDTAGTQIGSGLYLLQSFATRSASPRQPSVSRLIVVRRSLD